MIRDMFFRKKYDDTKPTKMDKVLAATFLRLLPKRVTPNQITIARFFSVPFAGYFVATGNYRVGIPLFIVSAFTDALDGALARTTNRVTEWGRMYDPMADKLLIGITALIIIPKYLSFTLAFTIIFIEMLVVGTAYYMKNKGTIHVSANGWGKMKMFLQSIGVGALLIYAAYPLPWIELTAEYSLYASIVFAVLSIITHGI